MKIREGFGFALGLVGLICVCVIVAAPMALLALTEWGLSFGEKRDLTDHDVLG